MIALAPALSAARSAAVRALIDGTAGAPGVLKLYGGAQPAVGAAAGEAPLAVITFALPCGVSDATGLTMTPPAAVLVTKAGEITWGRIEDSEGSCVLDADAAADDGKGGPTGVAIILDRTQVYPGASLTITSLVLSE